ncbi:MAG: TonB-dependent receptor [Candidatus Omnitrophica bacterium]|nr:TonB-dependent receptor [Candidatus Omnitrophota bacterium]
MAQIAVRYFAKGLFFIVVLGISTGSSWASEKEPSSSYEDQKRAAMDAALLMASQATETGTPVLSEKSKKGGKGSSFYEFMDERTQFGFGLEENYRSNLFLQDNEKQDEFISVLETELFFADPRGALLYGVDYEVNSYWYHQLERHPIDHDIHLFFDLDPGGRLKGGFQYDFQIQNFLVLGREAGINTLRRSKDFQKRLDHNMSYELKYALNNTNFLVQRLGYQIDRNISISNTLEDFDTLIAILDLDHNLTRNWILFGGYQFNDVRMKTDSSRDSRSHGIRTGLRHELSEILRLDTIFTAIRKEYPQRGKSTTDLGFEGDLFYRLNLRTEIRLRYISAKGESLSQDVLQFRSSQISGELHYRLTPILKATVGGRLERQSTDSSDILSSGSSTPTRSSRFGITAGLDWQMLEKLRFKADYEYDRAKTADFTEHVAKLQLETEF